MKTSIKVANRIKNADNANALISVMESVIALIDCDIQSVIKCADDLFAIACIKATRLGCFDKLMFEFPARVKICLAVHGWDWDMIDNCYDERRWDFVDQCYYAKRTWYNAQKHGIE